MNSQRPPTRPTASVVICAYTMDRWDDLTAAIESAYTGTALPEQIIVAIDYDDVLLERVREYSRSHREIPLTVIANSHRKGLSGARNSAVEAAEGEVVVFLDDDAVATPSWLETTLAHYSDDTVVGVGGSARPIWPQRRPVRPPTLPVGDSPYGDLDWVIGCSYRGQPTSPAEVRNLMGCNMSFRRFIFLQTHGFSEDLGRIGRTPLGCEETEFCIRVHRLWPELKILFEPAAVVGHRVSLDRMAWRYLIRRCYNEGISKAAVAAMSDRDLALQSERRYVSDVLVGSVVRELGQLRSGNLRGLLGASVICIGLGTTALGYLRGRAGRGGRWSSGVARAPLIAT